MTAGYRSSLTGKVVIFAVIIALLGLATHQPLILAAAISGLFVGVGIVGLRGTPEGIIVAAMLLPLGLVTVVVLVSSPAAGSSVLPGLGDTIAATGTAYTVLLLCVGALLGLTLVGTLTGEVSQETISDGSASAFIGTFLGLLLAGAIATATVWRETGSVYGTLFLDTGHGLSGFAGAAFITAIAVALACFAVPAGAVSAPARREQLATRRKQVSALVGVLTAVVVGMLGLGQILGASGIVYRVTGAPLLRFTLLGITVLSVTCLVLSLVVRWSWNRTEADRNNDVPILLGTLTGLLGIMGCALLLGVSPNGLFLVPLLLGVSGVGLWLLGLWWVRGPFGEFRSFHQTLPTTLALLCITGALAVGADVGETHTVGWSGFGSALALGAGLFTYSVGQYGTTLSDEIGVDGVRQTPQLVQIAYAGTVVLCGTVVALGGFWVAMVVAPTVSLSATVGLIGALLAVLVVATRLRE